MSVPIWTNLAKTTLASAITNVATTATLLSGSGALFPNPGSGQFFTLTFVSASNPATNEITYCTARSGDVVTIVRGQEGTTALAWNAGDTAANLLTAATITSHGALLNIQTFSGSGTYTPTAGTVSVIVEGVGGGGGGAGVGVAGAGNAAAGIPGNGGAYGRAHYTSGFSGAAVTVGAAGAGGIGAANGGNGGTTSFGGLLSCPGGPGGASGPPQSGSASGGNGTTSGLPTGANINGANGGISGLSFGFTTGQVAFGGYGGPSFFGPGGQGASGNFNGVNAPSPGAGGGGVIGINNTGTLNGGSGAAGLVIVWELS